MGWLQVVVNPAPEDLKDASATLFYAACPAEPLMALLDCSRGLNAKSRPALATSATVADLLEAAEEAVEQEFAEQSTVIMTLREQRGHALSNVATGRSPP